MLRPLAPVPVDVEVADDEVAVLFTVLAAVPYIVFSIDKGRREGIH